MENSCWLRGELAGEQVAIRAGFVGKRWRADDNPEEEIELNQVDSSEHRCALCGMTRHIRRLELPYRRRGCARRGVRFITLALGGTVVFLHLRWRALAYVANSWLVLAVLVYFLANVLLAKRAEETHHLDRSTGRAAVAKARGSCLRFLRV